MLVLQLAQNGINIALDFYFVLHLNWGVPGVAIATLIAEWGGLALGRWLARDAFGAFLRPAIARMRDRVALGRMFTASRDIMLRTILLQLSFTSFVFLGAHFGDTTLAANQVLMQFLSITAFALDGFAFAAEALVGQSVGARSITDTRRAGQICMNLGLAGAALLALAFAAAGPQIIALMTTSAEVRITAQTYMPWLILAPLIGVPSWIYDGMFIGAMMTGAMLRAMALSVAIYGLAIAILQPGFGNHGRRAALPLLNIPRGLPTRRAWSGIAPRLA